ncbi:MAG: response regulator [Pseudomonadota bacterium]
MPDDMTRLRWNRKPTPQHPLMGLTILAIEDSRFASEALRLAAMRSGARLRRADCLASARRHLSVYRPAVLLVDLGLPDGCGTELIAEQRDGDIDPPIILAMSGDDAGEARARQAGADGFLAKPLPGLAGFQAAILSHLPEDAHPSGPRPADMSAMEPDALALREDLQRAALALETMGQGSKAAYAAQFVASVARSAEDNGLIEAANRFARSHADGHDVDHAHGDLRRILAARLAETRAL